MNILRHSDYVAQPWKNGGGITYEIARLPNGVGAWDWRVSMALVEQDGPFSSFPGIDRTLLLVEGSMTLRSPESEHPLALDHPFHFRGETPIEGVIHSPVARDLNVMVRRDWGRAVVSVGTERTLRGPALAVALGDLSDSLSRFDTVMVASEEEVALHGGTSAFLFVEFRAHGKR